MKVRIVVQSRRRTCTEILFVLSILVLFLGLFSLPFIFSSDTIGFVSDFIIPAISVICVIMSAVSIILYLTPERSLV